MQQQQTITIDMIETKEFKTRARGYDQEEVDTFLDDICDEMERQQNVIADLRKQLDAARAELVRPEGAPVTAKAVSAVGSDDIREMLEITQRIKNETLAEAQKKADLILAEAQKKADEQLGDLAGQRVRLTDEVKALKAAVADYRARFLALVEEQKAVLENSDI